MRKKNFNPRSREGSDCDRVGRFREVCKFQSTLPRGERRFAICSPSLILGISIHAPARGATMQAQKRAILQRISIHAPARGATRSLFRIAKAGSYFNPRSREGSDVNPLPRRGASIRFQSTLPRGERQNSSTVATRSWIFQSTLPRGERQRMSSAARKQ